MLWRYLISQQKILSNATCDHLRFKPHEFSTVGKINCSIPTLRCAPKARKEAQCLYLPDGPTNRSSSDATSS